MKVYFGFDEREALAARVAAKTLFAKSRIEAELLDADRLRDAGLLWRLSDMRGQHYDLTSNAPNSTTFSISRFLTPILCQSGWALYTDCDVVFTRNPLEMLGEIIPGHPVYVVKHNYKPSTTMKMDGQAQTSYPRKAWSSVMLFDTSHPANKRLSIHDINARPGRDLHALYWLGDTEIGELNPAWNWLVNESPKPASVGICHFTLGGPWLPEWQTQEHDDIWTSARDMYEPMHRGGNGAMGQARP